MTATPPTPRARVRHSPILGPDGKPVAMNLYPTPRSNPRLYRPRQWLSVDNKVNVSQYDRMELVNLARQLRAQIPELDTAISQKNSFAFGDAWDPHFVGQDKDWGKIAKEWLCNVWFPNCNVRGPQFGFKSSMRISGMAWDVDGDDVMVLTENASGFPMLAFYPAPKIANYGPGMGITPLRRVTNSLGGNSSIASAVVEGGPFDGAKLHDGIILDRNNRMIGVRVLGDDGHYLDLSSYNCDLAYEPTWCDQGRGIPRVSVSLLVWMNIQDIDGFLQRGIKRASSIGLIQKNEDGEGAVGNEVLSEEDDPDAPAEGTDRQITYEEVHGGEMYYLSSAGGESIEGLTYKTPHPNVESFIERITRGALSSVGWFRELLDLGATGRAPSRILCDLANQSVWDRQQTGERRWRRAIVWAIAKGMKTGQLPRNSDGLDPYRWVPGLPAPLQVDAGNDAQADREALKLGMTTKAILAQKNHGRIAEDLDEQRDQEIRGTVERAKRLIRDHPELTFDRALELYEQRSPNPIAQNARPLPTTTPPKQ